jgi:hypothetical protein
MKCQFNRDNSNDENVNLGGQVVPINYTFQYLRSMLQNNGGINEKLKMLVIE